MESIEKLRKYADGFVTVQTHDDLMGIIDEIEAEIAERYMELPVDADGVPIHVGHLIEYGFKGERLEVTHIGLTKHGDPTIAYRRPNGTLDSSCIGSECRHVKPRTVEDVLEDMLIEKDETDLCTWGFISKYADEIRELLGVSE